MLERRKEKRALIISFLLHVALLLLFVFGAFKKSTLVTFITPADKKPPMNRPALIPKRSDAGTKIFFDNSTILPSPPPVKQRVAQKQEKKESPVEKTVPKKVAPVKEKMAKREKPKTTIEKPVDVKKAVAQNITKQVAQQQPQKMVPPKEKPRKSLLSLTKCFLDHDKGNSSMCRRGENRMPDFEEMKYICYEKQIQDQLVIAWRTLYAGQIPPPISRETRFTFVINEKCKAEQIQIVVSSGNRMFDDMLVTSVKSAVFPPIPKHFGVKKYRPQGGTIVLR